MNKFRFNLQTQCKLKFTFRSTLNQKVFIQLNNLIFISTNKKLLKNNNSNIFI